MFYNNLNSYSGNMPPINVNVGNMPPINVNVNVNNNTNNDSPIIKTINTDDDYYINMNQLCVCVNNNVKIDFMVIKANAIYLPIINSDIQGNTLKIINNTGNILNIYTQNNQLIFSQIYTSRQGNNNVMMNNKSMASFFSINSNDTFSWIMV